LPACGEANSSKSSADGPSYLARARPVSSRHSQASRLSSVNDRVLSKEPGTKKIEQLGNRKYESIVQREQHRVQFPLSIPHPFEQEGKEKSQRILIEGLLDIKARLVERLLERPARIPPAMFHPIVHHAPQTLKCWNPEHGAAAGLETDIEFSECLNVILDVLQHVRGIDQIDRVCRHLCRVSDHIKALTLEGGHIVSVYFNAQYVRSARPFSNQSRDRADSGAEIQKRLAWLNNRED
jgi:hypothetical protein